MSKLVNIPLVEGSSVELVRRFPDKARALARAAEGTFGLLSRAGSRIALPLGDRVSLAWLEKTANPYAAEIKELAGYLGIRGVAFLNICFEWGCTSGAVSAASRRPSPTSTAASCSKRMQAHRRST